MPFTKCLLFCLLLVSPSLVVAQGTAERASLEDLLDAYFVERAARFMNEIDWAFPGHQEVALSYTRDGQLDLRVQFPLTRADECVLRVWFVPAGEVAVYDQLLGIRENTPRISTVEAVRMLKVARDTRSIPCDSALARLLARAREFSIRFGEQETPEQRIYFDTPYHSVDLRIGDLKVTMRFPASLDVPLAVWAADVKEAVSAYIERGFKVP